MLTDETFQLQLRLRECGTQWYQGKTMIPWEIKGVEQ
jgi:hypothetical protein